MTTIPSAVTTLISSLPKLNNSNWFLWSKKMKMVFLAAELPGIVGGNVPTEPREKTAWDRRDTMMLAYLFMVIEEDLQYLVEEEESASVAMKKLREHFERSTMSMQIMARRELYDIVHDVSKSISHYVQSLLAARQKLEAFGCKIDDTEFKDVLLMHLHSSLHSIRTSTQAVIDVDVLVILPPFVCITCLKLSRIGSCPLDLPHQFLLPHLTIMQIPFRNRPQV